MAARNRRIKVEKRFADLLAIEEAGRWPAGLPRPSEVITTMLRAPE